MLKQRILIKNSIVTLFDLGEVYDTSTLPQLVDSITSSDFRPEAHKVRALVKTGKADELALSLKVAMAFAPAGTFSERCSMACFEQYSRLICVTLQLGAGDIGAIRAKVNADGHTAASFLSLCGRYLHVIVASGSDDRDHAKLYQQATDHFQRLTNLEALTTGGHLTELVPVTYDPEAYVAIEVIPVSLQLASDPGLLPSPPTSTESPALNLTAIMSGQPAHQPLEEEVKENPLSLVNMDEIAPNHPVIAVETAPYTGSVGTEGIQQNHEPFASVGQEIGTSRVDGGGQLQGVSRETMLLFDPNLPTPCIPDAVYNTLPRFFQSLPKVFSAERERDMVLTGKLVALSACLNINGLYGGFRVWPNLYGYVIAPPASGKGTFAKARLIAQGIEDRRVREFDAQLKDYQRLLRKRAAASTDADELPDEPVPAKPREQSLFVPGNSSSAYMYERLMSGESILLFQSESDSVGSMWKKGNGDYSSALREAFHHDELSYARKNGEGRKKANEPRLSVALAGTPSQVSGLVKSSKDGLLSRFMCYKFDQRAQWKSMCQSQTDFSQYFEDLAKVVVEAVDHLDTFPATFNLSSGQTERMDAEFERYTNQVQALLGSEAVQIVFRMGIICFRIAMVLTALRRYEEGETSPVAECQDVDFDSAMKLTEVYLQHTLQIFAEVDKVPSQSLSTPERSLLAKLPKNVDFATSEAVEIGRSLGLSKSSVEKYCKKLRTAGRLVNLKKGRYRIAD